jgi:hypothetical protein
MLDLKFVLRKILRLSKVKWNPNYPSGNCRSRLSMSTCQRIVRKDLDDSVTAERYRNNILDVFINQLQLTQGYFHSSLFAAFFDDRLINRDLWPALKLLDYYLFLHLKNTILKEPVCPHSR